MNQAPSDEGAFDGQGSPLSVQTNKNKTIIGCYQIEIYIKHSAPSEEGAVERSKTEGVKKVISIIITPSVIFCEKMTAPSEMGRKHELNLI